MKHVNALMPVGGTETNLSTSSPTEPDLAEARHVARIIVRQMDAAFGRRFRDQWPSLDSWKAAMIEWSRSCVPYGHAAVRAAFEAMKADPRAWPPSLPEFLDLVRNHQRPEHRRYVALPRPAIDRGTLDARILEMRRALGGG